MRAVDKAAVYNSAGTVCLQYQYSTVVALVFFCAVVALVFFCHFRY